MTFFWVFIEIKATKVVIDLFPTLLIFQIYGSSLFLIYFWCSRTSWSGNPAFVTHSLSCYSCNLCVEVCMVVIVDGIIMRVKRHSHCLFLYRDVHVQELGNNALLRNDACCSFFIFVFKFKLCVCLWFCVFPSVCFKYSVCLYHIVASGLFAAACVRTVVPGRGTSSGVAAFCPLFLGGVRHLNGLTWRGGLVASAVVLLSTGSRDQVLAGAATLRWGREKRKPQNSVSYVHMY